MMDSIEAIIVKADLSGNLSEAAQAAARDLAALEAAAAKAQRETAGAGEAAGRASQSFGRLEAALDGNVRVTNAKAAADARLARETALINANVEAGAAGQARANALIEEATRRRDAYIAKVRQDVAASEARTAALLRESLASQRLSAANDSAAASSDRMRAALGQVGFQVQDFATQVSMGQNALLAFGVQGAQLAGFFGATGALAGAGLMISVIAAQLLGMGDSASQAEAKIKTAFDGIKAESEGVRDLIKEIGDLFKSAAERAMDLARAQRGVLANNADLRLSNAVQLQDAAATRIPALEREIAVLERRAQVEAELARRAGRGGLGAPLDQTTDTTSALFVARSQLNGLRSEMDLQSRRIGEINAARAALGRTGSDQGQGEFGPPAPASIEETRRTLDQQYALRRDHAARLASIDVALAQGNTTAAEASRLRAAAERKLADDLKALTDRQTGTSQAVREYGELQRTTTGLLAANATEIKAIAAAEAQLRPFREARLREEQTTRGQEQQLELLRREAELVGANVVERERELAVLRERQRIINERQPNGQPGDPDSEASRARLANAAEIAEATQALQRQRSAFQEIERFGTQAFDRIGSAITTAFANGSIQTLKFSNILRATVSEGIQLLLRMAAINPLRNAVAGTNLPTLFGGLGGTLGGAAGVANAGSTTGAVNQAGQSAALYQAGTYGNLGRAFTTPGAYSTTGLRAVDSALNYNLISPTFNTSATDAALAASGTYGPLQSTAGFESVGAASSPGLTVGNALGGAAGIAGGALSIYQGAQKGGVGGGFQVAGGAVSAGLGAASLAAGAGLLNPGTMAILGSLGPYGWAAAAVLAIVGAMLPGEKASGKGQLSRINLDTEAQSFEGLGGKRFSADNRDAASDTVTRIADMARQIGDKLGGARIGGDVAVGVTSSRGSGPGDLYLQVGNQKGQYTNDEAGSKQLAEAAGQMILNEFRGQNRAQGDYAGILGGSGSLEQLQQNLDWYEGTYKALTKAADATNAFQQQIDALAQPYDDAIAKARQLSLAEDVLTQKRDEAVAKATAARDAQVANLADTLEMRRINAGLADGNIEEARSRVELRQVTAAAQEEVDQFRAQLEELGVSSDDVTRQVAQLTEVQAVEIAQRGRLVSVIKDQLGINASNLSLLERAKAAGLSVDAAWLEEAQARVQGARDLAELNRTLAEMGATAEEAAAQVALLGNVQAAELDGRARLRTEAAAQRLQDNFRAAQSAYVSALDQEISKREQVTAAARANVDALRQAADGLRSYTRGLALDSSLSPLTPAQRLEESRSQYAALMAQAQTGSPADRANAARQLQGIAGTRLGLASSYYAPGTAGYVAEFDGVTQGLNGLADQLGMSASVDEMALKAQEASLAVLREQREIAASVGVDTVKGLAELRQTFLDVAKAAGWLVSVGPLQSGADSAGGRVWTGNGWSDEPIGNFGAAARGDLIFGGQVTSGESLNAGSVAALYRQFLGRDPEAGIAEQWMQGGYRGFDLASALEQSAEFQGRLRQVQGFATGGSFTVAGPGGSDNLTLPNLRLTAGEIVNVSRGDNMAALLAAVKAQIAEIKALRADVAAHTTVTAQAGLAVRDAVDGQTEVLVDATMPRAPVPA